MSFKQGETGAVRLAGRWMVLLLAVSLAASCGGGRGRVSKNAPIEDMTPPQRTALGPGDVFDIRVYGEKELTNTFRVSSEGTIDFPLLGVVSVSGKTPTEVAEAIGSGLKNGDFIKQPQVSIFVKEYSSKKVSVFGQVKEPGTFPYQEEMSVVEAISIAGGFTSMARKNDTIVIREIEGTKKKFKVPVEEIGQGKVSNFSLRPGDIIFVPERIF